ncbi:GSCOCG00012436001-RA-CDS, partial [Cotesia congregata]
TATSSWWQCCSAARASAASTPASSAASSTRSPQQAHDGNAIQQQELVVLPPQPPVLPQRQEPPQQTHGDNAPQLQEQASNAPLQKGRPVDQVQTNLKPAAIPPLPFKSFNLSNRSIKTIRQFNRSIKIFQTQTVKKIHEEEEIKKINKWKRRIIEKLCQILHHLKASVNVHRIHRLNMFLPFPTIVNTTLFNLIMVCHLFLTILYYRFLRHQFRTTKCHQFRRTRRQQFRSTRYHQFRSTRRHSSLNIHPWLTILHTVIHLNTIPRDTINFLI